MDAEYLTYVAWCTDHHIVPLPERIWRMLYVDRVALKENILNDINRACEGQAIMHNKGD